MRFNFLLILYIIIILFSTNFGLKLDESQSQKSYELQLRACKGVGEGNSVITQEQRQEAKTNLIKIQQHYRKDQKNQYIEKVISPRKEIDSKTRHMNYLYSILNELYLFFILAGLSLIGCFTYILYSCYEPCCPWIKKCPEKYDKKCPLHKQLCKCCLKHKYLYKHVEEKKMFTGLSYYWPIICLTFSVFMLLAISIYGITSSKDLYDSFKSLSCAFIQILDSLAFGTNQWIGIEKLGQKVLLLNEEIYPFLQSVIAFFWDSTWLYEGLNSISTIMKLLPKEENGVSFTYKNNPLGNVFDYDDNLNDYIEQYYERYFGNDNDSGDIQNNQPSTFFGNKISPFYYIYSTDYLSQFVDNELTDLTNLMIDINEAGSKIKQQGTKFSDVLEDGKNSMIKLLNSLNSYILQLDKDYDNGDSITLQITFLLKNIFFAYTILSIGIFIPLLFYHFKEFYSMRYFMHFCWFTFSICQIITFVSSGILGAASIFGLEFCDVFQKLLNDKEFYIEYSDIIPINVSDKIFVCKAELGGDGQILKAFGINKQIQQMKDLEDKMLRFFNTIDSVQTDPLKNLNNKIEQIIHPMKLMRDQNYIADPTDNFKLLEHFYLDFALNSINVSLENCGIDHKFVKSQTECQGNLIKSLNKSVKNTDGCLWIGGSSRSRKAGYFTTDQIRNFYSEQQIKCPILYLKIENLLKWRIDKIILFDTKEQQTQQLNNSVDEYNKNIINYIQNIKEFYTQTFDVFKIISDVHSGILLDTNCLFIGEDLENIYDGFCLSLISNLYDLNIQLLYFGCCMTLCSFFLFKIAKKIQWNHYIYLLNLKSKKEEKLKQKKLSTILEKQKQYQDNNDTKDIGIELQQTKEYQDINLINYDKEDKILQDSQLKKHKQSDEISLNDIQSNFINSRIGTNQNIQSEYNFNNIQSLRQSQQQLMFQSNSNSNSPTRRIFKDNQINTNSDNNTPTVKNKQFFKFSEIELTNKLNKNLENIKQPNYNLIKNSSNQSSGSQNNNNNIINSSINIPPNNLLRSGSNQSTNSGINRPANNLFRNNSNQSTGSSKFKSSKNMCTNNEIYIINEEQQNQSQSISFSVDIRKSKKFNFNKQNNQLPQDQNSDKNTKNNNSSQNQNQQSSQNNNNIQEEINIDDMSIEQEQYINEDHENNLKSPKLSKFGSKVEHLFYSPENIEQTQSQTIQIQDLQQLQDFNEHIQQIQQNKQQQKQNNSISLVKSQSVTENNKIQKNIQKQPSQENIKNYQQPQLSRKFQSLRLEQQDKSSSKKISTSDQNLNTENNSDSKQNIKIQQQLKLNEQIQNFVNKNREKQNSSISNLSSQSPRKNSSLKQEQQFQISENQEQIEIEDQDQFTIFQDQSQDNQQQEEELQHQQRDNNQNTKSPQKQQQQQTNNSISEIDIDFSDSNSNKSQTDI